MKQKTSERQFLELRLNIFIFFSGSQPQEFLKLFLISILDAFKGYFGTVKRVAITLIFSKLKCETAYLVCSLFHFLNFYR